jgi:5-methyltetrahydropteroyltriglutamate--homocysteine methyltransferase
MGREMRRSTDRILTSHAGSLPRPEQLLGLNERRRAHEDVNESEFDEALQGAIDEVVQRQAMLGVDVVGDGEYGKAMSEALDYGAWRTYSLQRLSGITYAPAGMEMPVRRSSPGAVVLTAMSDRRDRTRFAEAYAETSLGGGLRGVCTGAIHYLGQDQIASDIGRFKSALATAGVEEGFMTSIGPASCARMVNEYYSSDEELLFACAEAMREEYLAIVNAGIVLQIDDPAIAESFDQVNPEPSVEDYLAYTMTRVEALNHALRGIPEDRVRFHLCWGSWHGPHSTDIPMSDIIGAMLAINAGGYSFEAANARHEHEWKIWREVQLPEQKVILPGIVSHATNVLEHPELVAERIARFASVVGRERVIASTDCGLGGRIHPQIAWAKLEALAEGAALASSELWG